MKLLKPFLFVLLAASAFAQAREPEPSHFIRVTSKTSLIHLGSLDSFDITANGTKAASMVFDCLNRADAAKAREASALYERLIPDENFGGEYTAMQWLCDYFASDEAGQKQMLADPLTAHWYQYLAKDNYEPLKDYLKKKYHLLEWKDRKTPKSEPKFRFLEDFILFNNPRRERWEKTSKILEVIGLKKGDVVADIGCGPGFYSFKFADLVGDKGYVYAIDINRQHIDYVGKLIKELGRTNIETVLSGASPKEDPKKAIAARQGTEQKSKATDTDAGDLKLARKADMAYLCSLYHNIYALDTDEERDRFMNSIKTSLKPDGTLVVVDNGMVANSTLPYHGPHISKDLIINSLWYYGFRLVNDYQFIPQRYILIFKRIPGAEPQPVKFAKPLDEDCVPLTSKSSVVRALKTTTSPGFTPEGRKAARLMATAVESRKAPDMQAAMDGYKALIPKERFGDEYLALQWLCEYLLASPAQREQKLEHWTVRAYFERVSADDFKMLKTYLQYKYYLDRVLDDDDAKRTGKKAEQLGPDQMELPESAPITQDQLNEFGDFLAFNSPYRENWEKTSKVLKFLKIEPGAHIADLGCGPGYYTFKFSALAGPQGKVYALDTLPTMTSYIADLCAKHDVHNVQTILCRDNDTRLPPASVDLVYICSMYHAIYMTSLEYVKDGFMDTMKRSLRKGARVVVADNAILKDSQNPYYGPNIAPELIITQFKQYGFKLVDRAQFIPQRYILVFELNK